MTAIELFDVLTLARNQAPRFWSKVVVNEGGCWLYSGATDKDGYGKFQITTFGTPKQIHIRAHRFSWLIHRRSLPDPQTKVLMHTCDVPNCVNPAHLRPGTQAENIRDRERKGRGRNGHM